MDVMRVLMGIVLPWALGSVWVRLSWHKTVRPRLTLLLGYGYVVGMVATTLIMRALNLAGIGFSLVTISIALLALIALGVWLNRGTLWPTLRITRLAKTGIAVVFYFFLMLISVRLATLGLEIMWRPLFPWDAWAQWATKAKVWYELGSMAQFVPAPAWFAGAAYTDSAPHYPATIPLIQTWMSYALGRWDDTLINLPWLACAIAAGLVFYGEARDAEVHPLLAIVFSYFLLSLPILNVHVALAGYADLFMAAVYGMAAMAFWRWAESRDRRRGLLALALILSCPLIKTPGIVWALTFIPAALVVLLPRRGLALAGVMAVLALALLGILAQTDPIILGYKLHANFSPVWAPLLQNYFVLDNWHLFWFVFAGLVLLSFKSLFGQILRAKTVLMLTGLTFLGVVFFFTMAEAWVTDFTTVNRATLHIVPALMFYTLLLAQRYFHDTALGQEV